MIELYYIIHNPDNLSGKRIIYYFFIHAEKIHKYGFEAWQ